MKFSFDSTSPSFAVTLVLFVLLLFVTGAAAFADEARVYVNNVETGSFTCPEGRECPKSLRLNMPGRMCDDPQYDDFYDANRDGRYDFACPGTGEYDPCNFDETAAEAWVTAREICE